MKNKKLAIYINKKCNRNCSFCYVNKDNSIMSKNIANKIIKYINDNNIYKTIIFVGGEPLLTPDIITHFINKINDKSIQYGIMTNGIIKDLNIVKTIPPNVFYNISLINETSKDNIHKINTIRHLQKLNINYNILIVNTPSNIDKLYDLIVYASKLNPDYIKILRQHKMGDIWNNNDIKHYKEILPKLIHLSLYFKEKYKTYNQISLPNKIDISINESKYVYDNYGINLVDQDSICNYDIVNIDGKQYLCDGACGEDDYCIGNIWDKPNNPYIIKNFGYQDILYDYCYLANNKLCLDFDRNNDMYRKYYKNILFKMERLKQYENI